MRDLGLGVRYRHADWVHLSNAAGAQRELGSYQADGCNAEPHTFPANTGYSSIGMDFVSLARWTDTFGIYLLCLSSSQAGSTFKGKDAAPSPTKDHAIWLSSDDDDDNIAVKLDGIPSTSNAVGMPSGKFRMLGMVKYLANSHPLNHHAPNRAHRRQQGHRCGLPWRLQDPRHPCKQATTLLCGTGTVPMHPLGTTPHI